MMMRHENQVWPELPTADAVVARYEAQQVRVHPFFEELRARPVDLSAMWLLMANLQVGISGHFVRWLAATIQRMGDFRISSLIAKQLNDELGNGDFREIHSALLEEFLVGLKPFRSPSTDEEVLQPGKRLLASMNALFSENDPFAGVGALMVSEIFASQMDSCVGDEIRRQSTLSARALRWLDIHETLELDHASDSALLAALVPTQGPSLAAVWHGATTEAEALWRFLDDVHAVASAQATAR